MNTEFELEGLIVEENKDQFISLEEEDPKDKECLSDRWASWVNIVNR